MVDTIKIYSMINKDTYLIIKNLSDIKCMYNTSENMIYYEIINHSLEGSYSSKLSVRVGEGIKYRFTNGYYIEIEGSYHKIVRGHNAYLGFYNIPDICYNLIKFVEHGYNIILPQLKHWFLQRIDIAICFDLDNNNNVKKYINNFRLLNYPRRNLKFYENETVYVPGSTNTLKIYNKYLEFMKNDKKKIINYNNFDILNFCDDIKGFIRFEIEIKKRKLKDIYKKNNIRVDKLIYNDFENIWKGEFMKLLKFDYSKLKKVRTKDEVRERLFNSYKTTKATVLYAFFLSLMIDGYNKTRINTSKTTFYRKLKDLKEVGVDFSQCESIVVDETKLINFDPFTAEKVL